MRKDLIIRLFNELKDVEYTNNISCFEIHDFCSDFLPDIIAMNLEDSFFLKMAEFYNKNI